MLSVICKEMYVLCSIYVTCLLYFLLTADTCVSISVLTDVHAVFIFACYIIIDIFGLLSLF
jgi:hypothetical protein